MIINKTQQDTHIPKIQLTNAHTTSDVNEGDISWSDDENTIKVDSGLGTDIHVGHDTYIKVYNDSGATINKGSAVYHSGLYNNYPTISKAQTDILESVFVAFGLTAVDIPNNSWGLVVWFGKLDGLDTSGFSVGDDLYISPTTAGAITNVRPEFPDYVIQIGAVFRQDASNGQVFITGKTAPRETTLSAWDGAIREKFSFSVSATSSVITGSLECDDNTRDLTVMFSDGLTVLDVTPAMTLTLTQGTDTNPQVNYVYIDKATKTLNVATAGWPVTEHAKVAQLLLKTASATQADGALINQNWWDSMKDSDDNGHILHITERLRQEPAKWNNGVETLSVIGGGGTTVDINTTSGNVYLLHNHAWPAMDTSTGSKLHIINDSVSPYKVTTDLETQLTDSTGASLLDSCFSFVVWGVQNKAGENSQLMVNLPTGSYAYTSPDDAAADVDGKSVYTIPAKFKKVGFLLARFTYRLTAGTVWSLYNTQDLRGAQPSNTSGGTGGGGGGITEFTALNDTPSTYFGKASNIPTVNAGESGLEFVAPNTAYNKNLGTTAGTVSEGDHTHTANSITNTETGFNKAFGTTAGTVSEGNHTHVADTLTGKNTAFNKNFGTTAGTVTEGDHTHAASDLTGTNTGFNLNLGTASNNVAQGNHTHAANTITGTNTAYNKNFGTTAGTVSEGDHVHPTSVLYNEPAAGLPSTSGTTGKINFNKTSGYYSEAAITAIVTWGLENIVVDKVMTIDCKTTSTIKLLESGITFKGAVSSFGYVQGLHATKSNLISIWAQTATVMWVTVAINEA